MVFHHSNINPNQDTNQPINQTNKSKQLLAHERQRQMDLCDLEASLVYVVNSGTTKALKRPCLTKQNKKPTPTRHSKKQQGLSQRKNINHTNVSEMADANKEKSEDDL